MARVGGLRFFFVKMRQKNLFLRQKKWKTFILA
ncbi:hypothetical protein HPSA_03505 [Helicobacter pylori SouthAfrica7]|uniref:Uncharacterized protein n=1 Tax=Helicobacter pylori (strain SouthAfrica7) TaxID=907239 RepID=E8QRT6_HELPW|nr:hypothetical protein HPSA_03505 [Helicobacter pylori SouthAfrica7]